MPADNNFSHNPARPWFAQKEMFLMIIPVLIYGVTFTSCNADKEETKLKTPNGLYVIGTKTMTIFTNLTDLVFTEDDIVSFDATSLGNMVFIKEKMDEIISRARLYSYLHFFIDGKPVFSSPIKIWFWRDTLGEIDLCFCIFDDNIQLIDVSHIMHIHWIDEKAGLEFAAKMEKRKKELDVLINYLSDAGKIVDK